MKRILSLILCVCLFVPVLCTAASAQAQLIGTAYVAVQDYGVRNDWEDAEDIKYPQQLGVIVPKKEVKIYEGDTVATVTMRAFDESGIDYSFSGTAESGFYLKKIKNFKTEDGTAVAEFGEFDSGEYSGWMVSCDNWFINLPAAQFTVSDGDYICWQNTCMYGLDIGCDMMGTNPSAAITGIKIDEKYGTLTPEFSAEQKEYTLKVPYEVNCIRVEALQSNYWATCSYMLVDTEEYYKLNRDIPVSDGSQILIETQYAEYYGDPPTDTDYALIIIEKESLAEYLAPFAEKAYAQIEAAADASLYREAQQVKLAEIKAQANAKVAAAQSPEEISAAVEEAITAVSQLKTDAQLKAEEESVSFWQRILNFLKRIFEFLKGLFTR